MKEISKKTGSEKPPPNWVIVWKRIVGKHGWKIVHQDTYDIMKKEIDDFVVQNGFVMVKFGFDHFAIKDSEQTKLR